MHLMLKGDRDPACGHKCSAAIRSSRGPYAAFVLIFLQNLLLKLQNSRGKHPGLGPTIMYTMIYYNIV